MFFLNLTTLLRECLNQNLILSLRRQVWPDDSDHGDGKFFKFQDKSSSSDSGLFSLSPLNLLNTRAHLPISVQRRRAYKSRYDNIPACAVLDDVSARSRAVHHFRLPLRSMAAARNVARDDHAVTMPHARCYHPTSIQNRECVFICMLLHSLYVGPCTRAVRPGLSCAWNLSTVCSIPVVHSPVRLDIRSCRTLL